MTCLSIFQHLHFDALSCYLLQSVVEQTLFHSQFCSVGTTVCHQPHETLRAGGFIVFFGPWYPSFFMPSWPLAECFLSASSAHICVLTKTTRQFYTTWVFPFYPLATPPPPPHTQAIFFPLSTGLSPGDIRASTGDHHMATSPTLEILNVEKWQVAAIKWQTSEEWHHSNRHVMNRKTGSSWSFHLISDRKCWFSNTLQP